MNKEEERSVEIHVYQVMGAIEKNAMAYLTTKYLPNMDKEFGDEPTAEAKKGVAYIARMMVQDIGETLNKFEEYLEYFKEEGAK
jgi:hypothetical protein